MARQLALGGARVVAVDLRPLPSPIAGVRFVQGDMLRLPAFGEAPFDIILCQRAIHYLPYARACHVVQALCALLRVEGRLYLSASGLNSELGAGYRASPLIERHHELCPEMAEKHNIFGPVCLYEEGDMQFLLEKNGFVVEQLFVSPFGNIKAVARPR